MRGDPILGMPPLNTQRIPLFNQPAPNVLKMQSPERLYRKFMQMWPDLQCLNGLRWMMTWQFVRVTIGLGSRWKVITFFFLVR